MDKRPEQQNHGPHENDHLAMRELIARTRIA
jgi:hypothetical protein